MKRFGPIIAFGFTLGCTPPLNPRTPETPEPLIIEIAKQIEDIEAICRKEHQEIFDCLQDRPKLALTIARIYADKIKRGEIKPENNNSLDQEVTLKTTPFFSYSASLEKIGISWVVKSINIKDEKNGQNQKVKFGLHGNPSSINFYPHGEGFTDKNGSTPCQQTQISATEQTPYFQREMRLKNGGASINEQSSKAIAQDGTRIGLYIKEKENMTAESYLRQLAEHFNPHEPTDIEALRLLLGYRSDGKNLSVKKKKDIKEKGNKVLSSLQAIESERPLNDMNFCFLMEDILKRQGINANVVDVEWSENKVGPFVLWIEKRNGRYNLYYLTRNGFSKNGVVYNPQNSEDQKKWYKHKGFLTTTEILEAALLMLGYEKDQAGWLISLWDNKVPTMVRNESDNTEIIEIPFTDLVMRH